MITSLNPVKRLEWIRELLDHTAIDYEDLARKFRCLLKDSGYRKHPYIIRIPALVRATCHSEESWFDNSSKFNYPPKQVLIKKGGFGRCNWPVEPVFYCSYETGVPVFEVRPSIGSYVVLSHWGSRLTNKVEFYGVALGTEAIMNSLREDDPFLSTLRQDDIFKDTTSQAIKDIDRYVAKLFIEEASLDGKIYQLTSSIAKIYFDGLIFESTGKKINGLIYPSVATQLEGFNVALTTDFVDVNLHPQEARMYQVISYNEEAVEYQLKPVKRVKSSYPTGELVWEYVHKDVADQIWTLSPQSPTILI